MATAFGVIGGIYSMAGSPLFFYGTVLGIKNYWEGPPTLPIENQVRMHLGASRRADMAQIDGNQPGVAMWAEDGTVIGRERGTSKKWGEASHIDLTVKPWKGQDNRPGEYLAISDGGDDAICIAAIEVSHPDGSKSSISGDMIVGCGGINYYPSNKLFGDNYRPNCFWLDRNRSNGLKHQGISVHLPDVKANEARVKQYNDNIDTWCKSAPRFSMHENMRVESNIPIFWPKLEYNPDGTDRNLNEVLHPRTIMSGNNYRMNLRSINAEVIDKGNATTDSRPVTLKTIGADIEKFNAVKEADEFLEPIIEDEVAPIRRNKRDTGRSAPRVTRAALHPRDAAHYVRSSHPEHSAAGLCNSEFSWGPSFTNPVEGLHCDMETKTIYPLCAEGVMETCFDNDENEIREPAPLQNAKIHALVVIPAAKPVVHKKYDEVVDWE